MRAKCSKCGELYYWSAYRGSKLKDYPSPCCHVTGEAVRGEYIEPVTKRCPNCSKAGLRDKAPDGHSFYQFADAGNYQGQRYCPRCQKWVIPNRELQKV